MTAPRPIQLEHSTVSRLFVVVSTKLTSKRPWAPIAGSNDSNRFSIKLRKFDLITITFKKEWLICKWSEAKLNGVPFYYLFPIYGYPKFILDIHIQKSIYGYPKIHFWISKNQLNIGYP